MPVIVKSKEELKKAIRNKEEKIIIRGRLADKIKHLQHVPETEIESNMSETRLQSVLAGAITPAVAMTLILVVGVVAIIAIINGYKISVKTEKGEVILERK